MAEMILRLLQKMPCPVCGKLGMVVCPDHRFYKCTEKSCPDKIVRFHKTTGFRPQCQSCKKDITGVLTYIVTDLPPENDIRNAFRIVHKGTAYTQEQEDLFVKEFKASVSWNKLRDPTNHEAFVEFSIWMRGNM